MLTYLNSLNVAPDVCWQETAGEGRSQVTLTLLWAGQAVQALLTGGDEPHLGGVVLAVPRPSLSGDGISADTFIIPVPGHKDVEVALPAATALARLLNQPVSVSAGIHAEAMHAEEIAAVRQNCAELTQRALAYCQACILGAVN